MSDLFAAMDRTWPAASIRHTGGWLVREGLGGGRRVSAASAVDDSAGETIAEAEAAHAALGQPAVFQVRAGQDELDASLEACGYHRAESVTLLAAPLAKLAEAPPERMTSFPIWPPLAIMTDIWAECGIGPARLAVMDRADVPKTAILGRSEDRAAGSIYVAVDGPVAMVHSLHVLPALRRKGLARNLMRAAAVWALEQGGHMLALAVEDHNDAAISLYRSFGMKSADSYHYRAK